MSLPPVPSPVQLKAKQWRGARTLSDRANELIAQASGTATLEDIRRNMGYDGNLGTDRWGGVRGEPAATGGIQGTASTGRTRE